MNMARVGAGLAGQWRESDRWKFKGSPGDALGRQIVVQVVLSWTCRLTSRALSPFQS